MPTTSINLAWDASYQLIAGTQPQRLIILLHGFQQTGEEIFEMLKLKPDEHTAILAPNAPFPIPQKQATGYRAAYAWYFFDPETGHYLHDMGLACRYLSALVLELGLENLPTYVIGFSQGGYLAPHVGLQLAHTRQVIGINCRFRSEALLQPLPFLLDSVSGEKDVLVDPDRAEKCHQELMARGNQGRFELVPGAGHGLSAPIRSTMKGLLFREADPA